MNKTKMLTGCLWVAAVIAFCLWNRDNPNGFWWTGFCVFTFGILASSLMSTFEKEWIRIFRLTSALGIFLNGWVIVSNGGRMPVINFNHQQITGLWREAISSDRFLFLCDRYQVFFGTMSIGDIVLFLSVIGLVLLNIFERKHDKNIHG